MKYHVAINQYVDVEDQLNNLFVSIEGTNKIVCVLCGLSMISKSILLVIKYSYADTFAILIICMTHMI